MRTILNRNITGFKHILIYYNYLKSLSNSDYIKRPQSIETGNAINNSNCILYYIQFQLNNSSIEILIEMFDNHERDRDEFDDGMVC